MGRTDIKKSLILQLQIKGADLDHFKDMVDDYMSLWDIKCALIKDIKKRGVTYKDFSSVGVEMQKNNPSVKELVAVNRQMLSILKELEINTRLVVGEDDGSEM